MAGILQMIATDFLSRILSTEVTRLDLSFGKTYLKEVEVQTNIVASRNRKAKRLLQYSRLKIESIAELSSGRGIQRRMYLKVSRT